MALLFVLNSHLARHSARWHEDADVSGCRTRREVSTCYPKRTPDRHSAVVSVRAAVAFPSLCVVTKQRAWVRAWAETRTHGDRQLIVQSERPLAPYRV